VYRTLDTLPVARGRLPLLGHLAPLLADRLRFMESVREQGPLVRIDIGSKSAYVVNSPDLIHQMFVSDAAGYSKGKLFEKSRAVVGDGLLTSEGDLHRRQRRLMQPAFHRDRIAEYVDIMRDQTERSIADWSPGQSVDVHDQMFRIALAVTAKCLFASELGRAATDEVNQSLPTLLRGIAWRTLSPLPLLERIPVGPNRRFAAANTRIRRTVAEVITAYRSSGRDHGDVLSMLLTAQDQGTGQGMSDEQIHDEITTLLITGTASSAATLSWLFYELAKDTANECRLHDELDAHLAASPIQAAGLPALAHTGRLITEVLRLHHPVWIATRRTTVTTHLGEVSLPPGTDLIWSLYALHRDSALFPNPVEFRPDRWMGDQGQRPSRETFLPFGAGNRQCIGDVFARTMATIVVATIARRWRLVLQESREVQPVAWAAVRPANFTMRTVPRS
jgi:cytochrome P450